MKIINNMRGAKSLIITLTIFAFSYGMCNATMYISNTNWDHILWYKAFWDKRKNGNTYTSGADPKASLDKYLEGDWYIYKYNVSYTDGNGNNKGKYYTGWWEELQWGDVEPEM